MVGPQQVLTQSTRRETKRQLDQQLSIGMTYVGRSVVGCYLGWG